MGLSAVLICTKWQGSQRYRLSHLLSIDLDDDDDRVHWQRCLSTIEQAVWTVTK